MKDKILKLRSEGKTYNEIKKQLGCSKSTIAYHCGEGCKKKSAIRHNNLRREKRLIQREYVRRVKSFIGCIDCRNKDWRCLDFDHVKGEKSYNISNGVGEGNFSISQIKDEMRKCNIRCANCHRIKTFQERQL